MEAHQRFVYGVPVADASYELSSASTPTYSEWSVGPMKFDLGNSPNSPLFSRFDCDTFSAFSNSQEQYSSTDIISGISPSHNSPDSLFKHSSVNPAEVHRVQSSPLGAVSSQSERHFLQEIETILMGPDADEATASTPADTDETKHAEIQNTQSSSWNQESPLDFTLSQPRYVTTKYQKVSQGFHPEKCPRESKEIPGGDVKQLLTECAKAIYENKLDEFDMLVQEVEKAVSITGEPIHRLGAYMLEGLIARREASGTNIYRAMRCRQPKSNELLSYMQILYDICPYFKFGYMAANGAIAEAVRNEDRIHIIDFQIAQGTQWVTLIQALAARPGGPPHLRITGIDDAVSEYARGESLHAVGKRLTILSQKFNIPFEFNAMPVYWHEVTREMLDIRSGEALAVNFTLQLHHTPDESVDVNNPRDGLLRMVRGLSPKVTTLVEQESSTNTAPFLSRFMEALDYYSAMFESIDVTLQRDNRDRINVEQHCLAKDIVNIIACEGKERVERHELLGKWKSRLTMAGFKPYPLSSYVNSVIRLLLKYYCDKYTLVEKDGAMLLGWKERSLISASAWH